MAAMKRWLRSQDMGSKHRGCIYYSMHAMLAYLQHSARIQAWMETWHDVASAWWFVADRPSHGG